MLVLTRKLGEGIAVGDDIRVVVVEIRGNQVRLGIKAPPEMSVYREEVWVKIVSENRLAADFRPDQLQKVLKRGVVPRKAPEKEGRPVL